MDRALNSMEDIYNTLLFNEEGDPERLRRQLEAHPDLARAWAHWRAVRTHLRQDLQERLPDRNLLVLYALDEAGADDALTPDERMALDAARDDIEAVLETVPALRHIVDRIQEDREAFETAWAEQMDGASTPSVRRPQAASGEEAGRSAEREARGPRRPSRTTSRRSQRWVWRLAAAVALAGIVALSVLFWPAGPSRTTVEVDDGTIEVVELADGSTVRLVGAATLTYPRAFAEEGERRVTLEEGRAFFTVPRSPEAARFVVQTPMATTTVLGTQFAVSTGADTTGVVLADGRVRLSTEEATSLTLEPGQRSRVVRGQPPAAPTATDLTDALNWTGLFVFRSTPVEAIAKRLRRHYEAEIVVAPSLREERVTGTFEREQSVRAVLTTLAATLGVDVQQADDEQYRLGPRP